MLRDEKLHPLVIIPVILFVFGYLSYLIIIKKHDALFYVFMVLYILIFKIISTEKRQFYQQQFSPKTVYWLQVIELSIVALPFILCLLIYKYLLYSSFVIAVILLFPFFNIRQYNFSSAKIVPTPYLKESYEMNYGFRGVWLLNIILTIPFVMSIYVGNSNLFLGVLIIYACIQTFVSYSIFEDAVLLRQYLLSPSKIIFIKSKQIVINHFAFAVVALVCSLFFKELEVSLITLLIVLFSILYNCLVMLLKYSFFQHVLINAVAQAFLLLVFFIIPAMPWTALLLPFLYYIFYKKATNNLKQILL